MRRTILSALVVLFPLAVILSIAGGVIAFFLGFLSLTPIVVENKQPRDILRISGSIPSWATLEVVAVYETTNPLCRIYPNLIELGFSYDNRVLSTALSVSRPANDRYEVSIPLDKFERGTGNWSAARIYYLLGDTGEPPADVDPTLDSKNNGGLGIPLFYFLTPGLPPQDRTVQLYGRDWSTLSVVCHRKSNYRIWCEPSDRQIHGLSPTKPEPNLNIDLIDAANSR